jgi:uncharacterized protein YkwD
VALSTFSSDFPAVFSQELQDVAKSFDEIRTNLLQLVNEERAVEKVSALALDEFATRVATKHAIDMATGKFANHWGRDGLKPYQRYPAPRKLFPPLKFVFVSISLIQEHAFTVYS